MDGLLLPTNIIWAMAHFLSVSRLEQSSLARPKLTKTKRRNTPIQSARGC